MPVKRFLISIFLTIIVVSDALAQQLEEVIVTASRRTEGRILPVVHLTRKADFLVMLSYVESDSRDLSLRRKEVMETIDNLEKQAHKNSNIKLGILKVFEVNDEDLEYIEPFSREDIVLRRGHRSDTSRAEIIIKTPIRENDDSPEKVLKRIEDFIESVQVKGRATLNEGDGPSLSVTNISQYREPLLKALAEDTTLIQSSLGKHYQVRISGLEQPLLWRIIGPLKLAIFFSYESEAIPK